MAVKNKKTKVKKSKGDAYTMIMMELLELLNYTPEQLFEKDYNFVMNALTTKAQSKIDG